MANSTSEALNRRIQSINSAAKRFRKFECYRIRSLFYDRKLSAQAPASYRKCPTKSPEVSFCLLAAFM
ncbi:MAG: hypothetical protein K9M08_24080 [Pirellula sp.]|nr:hypothetical protein [Pirellula sp.]